MKLALARILGIAAWLALSAFSGYSQQTAKLHPWSLKTDLLGFRSHSFSLEGEVFLFWRVSAFAQVGVIAGYQRDRHWRSNGYLGRAGFKVYLSSKEKPRMSGLALRCEAAKRDWRSYGDGKTLSQTEIAVFAGASYSWNPFERLVVEPCLGVGMSAWQEWFSDPNLIGGPTGLPNPPWFHLGRLLNNPVYDSQGDLVGFRGSSPQLTVGLMIGVRF